MAKKQTFESKLNKGGKGSNQKVIKVIYAYESEKTKTVKFTEQLVKMPADANEQQVLEDKISSGALGV